MQQVDLYKSTAEAAYQGAPGAFSEQAAQILVGADAQLMPCATVEQAFDAVVDARASHTVIPVESAVSGTVPTVYEQLLVHDLVVTGEVSINIDHVLVAPSATRREHVRRVMSHPLALAQCADFFRRNRGIEAVSVFDTAGAVRMVMEAGDGVSAAIASRRAASLYGATIIAEHIQDDPENWTRFLLLAARTVATQPQTGRKAMVACGLRHEPGALAHALLTLADKGLSVTKIEGRPIRGKPFEYCFVIETVAHDGGKLDSRIFAPLETKVQWVRVLGIYDPTDVSATAEETAPV
jgi:prephenate dehydratase